MVYQRSTRAWTKFLIGTGLAFSVASTSLGEDLSKTSSLKLVPVDADIYVGAFKLEEQWQQFAKGPVAAKFWSLAVVKDTLQQFNSDWKKREGSVGTLRTTVENPNVAEAILFAEELCSKEMFIFADSGASQWLSGAGKVNAAVEKAMADSPDADKSEILFDKWIDAVKDMKLPMIVAGARCEDEDLAIMKVDQLEAALRFASQMSPDVAPLNKALKRIDDDRGSRLTIELAGKMIPWDAIPINDDFDEEMRDSLKSVLESKTVSLTIGTLDKYFLMALAPQSKDVLKLGSGETLWQHADMEVVRKVSDKSITNINYLSDRFAAANYESQGRKPFSNGFASMLQQMEDQLDEESELWDFFDDVEEDLSWLDDSMAKYMPESKGTTGYSFITPKGWEQVQHIRTKNGMLDGTSKLAGLKHVGSDPLMFVVTRIQNKPEYFQLFRQVANRFKTRLDDALELDWSELGNDKDLSETKGVVEIVWPILNRFADVWETKFLPSFTGEHGLVMHTGNLAATQWAKEMPPSKKPLPIPELALLSGVKDQQRLKEGFVELFDICDSMVDTARKLNPEAVPSGYSVPRPSPADAVVGEKYGYPIPDDCPVPKGMMPHGLFAGDYFIGSYSEKQSTGMANEKALSVASKVIDDSARLANASYVHVGKMFAMVRPWIRYGIDQGVPDADKSLFDSVNELQAYPITANDLIELWQVVEAIGEFASTTVQNEDGTTVIRATYQNQSLP